MSDIKCPFCNKPLQPTLRLSDEYWCENYDCPRTNIEWAGSKKLWQSLINERQHATDCQDLFIEAIAQKLEIETELERTRKALDILLLTINRLENQNYKDCAWHLRLAIAKIKATGIANKALEQITALEQGGDNGSNS